MNEFPGKVAVITGAASGIGRAIAAQAAREGMALYWRTLNGSRSNGRRRNCATGADVLAGTPMSAARRKSPRSPNDRSPPMARSISSSTMRASRRRPDLGAAASRMGIGMGVNLWGVVHGIRTFVPLMLAQEDAGYIVNTASIAGLVTAPALGIYTVTKHAVVALSEVLAAELAQRDAHITVSVLCPSWVQTRILEAGRNRPAAIQMLAMAATPTGNSRACQLVESGIPPDRLRKKSLRLVRDQRFYILTHPETKAWIRRRMETSLATPAAVEPNCSANTLGETPRGGEKKNRMLLFSLLASLASWRFISQRVLQLR